MDLQDRYATGLESDIAGAIAEELDHALKDMGFSNPDASMIREHAKMIETDDGGLEFYWDDKLLIRTEPMATIVHVKPQVADAGIRIIRNDGFKS